MKCLLVLDSATMHRILARALREAGCEEIVDARFGIDALEQCDQTTDMVITEWGMQGTDAVDLAKGIRAKKECKQTRILILSARNDRDDVNEAVQAGVDGYILKPFTSDTLRSKLEEFLKHSVPTEPAEPADDAAPPGPAQEALSGSDTQSPAQTTA